MVDVLIQTFNEELNLPHTLESLRGWAENIFIVDSGSTDGTTRIAEEFGATTVYHKWEGYARQKNWALANLPLESRWTLILDADESVTPELRREIVELCSRNPDTVKESGFQLNRVLIFNGSEIRHCGYFPSWNLRLFKRGQARYEDRLVHEHMIVDGPVGHLRHLLRHEDRRGLEHNFAKHNRYSTLEAMEVIGNPEPFLGLTRFLRNRVHRRRLLKSRILPYTPMPWTMRFFYMYFIKLGFLDGRAGLEFSNFIATYEYLIRAKYRELRRVGGRQIFLGSGLAMGEGTVTSTEAVDEVKQRQAALPVPDAELAVPKGMLDVPPPSIERAVVPGGDKWDRPSGESIGRLVAEPAEQGQPNTRVPVSVIIPTLNEARNLPRCLDHLQWADEIVVVDSGSKDQTQTIATTYGAKVIDFKWNGRWPKKKNWALRHAPLKHEWRLIVDADEWITPELAAEVRAAIAEPNGRVGFYLNRKFIFMGRWIKHCGYYPSWNLRLIRHKRGEYEQLTEVGDTGSGDNEVHEHVVADGPVGYFDHDMLHFAFPNIHTFMEKHNRYSNWEAAVQFKKADTMSSAIGAELSKRRRLKNLSRHLPMRPALRFLYSYIWKFGFLDGKPGYIFSRLLGIYEYLSVAKYTEARRAEDDARNAYSLSTVPEFDWRDRVAMETKKQDESEAAA